MKIEAIIKNVVFTSEDYSVVEISIGKESINACGNIPYPRVGQKLTLTGTKKFNKNYNQEQFYVDDCESNDNSFAIIKFLCDFIPGIGEKRAQSIAIKYSNIEDYFKDAPKIQKDIFKDKKMYYELYQLTNGSITKNQATRIIESYEEESASTIKENPYILTQLDGFGFKKADKIAKGCNIPIDSNVRILAGIHYILKNAKSNGHVFIYINELKQQTLDLLFEYSELKHIYYDQILKTTESTDTSIWDDLYISKLTDKQLQNIIEKHSYDTHIKKLEEDEVECLKAFIALYDSMAQKIDQMINKQSIDISNAKDIEKTLENNKSAEFVIETYKSKCAVYEMKNFKNEYYTAKALVTLTNLRPIKKYNKAKVDAVIAQVEKEDSIADGTTRKFNKDQIQAVHNGLKYRVSIITGGPGRGKTTILRAVCRAWGTKNTVLLAPTGKAANKMYHDTGVPASTIHRYIRKVSEIPDGSCVIIDETSMLDLDIIAKVLKRGAHKKFHIIFVGDKDQLPSIGVGAILEDLILSETIPCTILTECYRNDGSILKNVNIVNSGGRIQDFVKDIHTRSFLDDRRLKVESIVGVYKHQVKEYGITNTTILTPMNRGEKGVENLNKLIQQAVNPNGRSITIGKKTFREGDRVINIKNNYKINCVIDNEPALGVFNGEVGIITGISYLPKKITVKFDDGKVAFYQETPEVSEKDALSLLDLAYATTIHKSQGSEYESVILYMDTSAYLLLSRKLLYTAMSRAKKHLILLGTPKAYYIAINNAKVEKRHTRMEYRLRSFKEAA